MNTLRVRDHSEALREQLRLASELAERLNRIQRLAEPEDAWRYAKLCDKARGIEHYLYTMKDSVDMIGDHFEGLSFRISEIIEDGIYNAKRIL